MKTIAICFLLFLLLTNECNELERVKSYINNTLIPFVEALENNHK